MKFYGSKPIKITTLKDNMNLASKNTVREDTASRHLKKYSNPNFFHQLTLSRFFDKVAEEIQCINPLSVLEFGCGEGLFLQQLKMRKILFKNLIGIDDRDDALQYAKSLHPEYEFVKVDLLSWDRPGKSFELVIASQVLEHLIDPEQFMDRLVYFSNQYLFLTVPWEPWFRLMNILRGRDILRLGNHPEHINLWGIKQFKKFVSKYAKIEKAYTVFPFIIIVARI